MSLTRKDATRKDVSRKDVTRKDVSRKDVTRKEIEKQIVPFWDEAILPTLTEYIRIPNQSPAFDKDWAKNGHMAKAMKLVAAWVKKQKVPGLTLQVLEDGGRTPVLLCDIPGELKNEVLIYGHLDKQPPMTG